MAITAASLKLPLTPPLLTATSRLNRVCHSLPLKPPPFLSLHKQLRSRASISRAVEESKDQESTESEANNEAEIVGEVSELGAEIKKAMMERKEEREGDLLSGVAEEIQEIEWPAFGKVLGTTGVVLGVIAGSSVVLLTVNFVLAELSDRVFAGRGVQDFFN